MTLGIASIILEAFTLGVRLWDSLRHVIVCGLERHRIVLILLQKESFMILIGINFRFKVYALMVGM